MGERAWPNLLATLLRGDELSTQDTAWAMDEIMSGSATPAQIAGFVVGLRAKGESPREIAGLVEAMLGNATPLPLPEEVRAEAVDVVGTGGDRAHTVNISTMSAVVVAGAGLRVVKHGNRAATSACGAADLLEQLGLPLDLNPAGVARCVREAGIGFCFAPMFHAGLRHAGSTRRELGVPTAFNFLGPLTNPGRPRAGAVGCSDSRMAPVLASVFAARGDSAVVMRGEDGLDEFTTAAPTRIWAAFDGAVTEAVLDAADLGLPRSGEGDLRGGDAEHNAEVARRVFAGEPGPIRDAVLVNSAVAITAQAGVGGDIAASLRTGIEHAAVAIDSGSARAALDRWIALATRLRAEQ